MAKFGGTSKFGGLSKFGGEVAGFTPAYLVTRITGRLARFKLGTGTSNLLFVRTIGRMTGALDDPEVWSYVAQMGTPAWLVLYSGGAFLPETTSAGGNRIDQQIEFSIISVCEHYWSRIERLEGRGILHPGLDQMQRLALHWTWRELLENTKFQAPRPLAERYLQLDSERFVGVVTFTARVPVEGKSDWPTDVFDRLGVCFDYRSGLTLFEDDNETPDSTGPFSPVDGVHDFNVEEP